MSLDGGEPVSMVTGEIDKPQIHWGQCTVSVLGRDKSASLTEKRRSQQFKNQTSADIVAKIAKDHGLEPIVTAGSGFAGKIYDVDTVHVLLNLSDHEVLSRLAEREGFRWFVDGLNLIFEPKGTVSGVYQVQWVPPQMRGQPGVALPGFATCTDLWTDRNMTAARPHTLAVRSFHHKDRKKYDGLAEAGGVGRSVEIEHHHNGRNQAQADQLSKSRIKDAIRHDCNVLVKAPADLSTDVRQKLQLAGTRTIYDQFYDIDSVETTVAWALGADMSAAGKIAKSGRSGSDNTGATRIPSAPQASTGNDTPVTTPQNSVGIGSA